MTTEQTTELAGIELRPIATTVDAIREDVVLGAIIDAATARRKAIKAYLLHTMVRPGTKVEDELGYALVTDPKPRPVLEDEDAFRGWWLANRPEESETVESLDLSVIEAALRGDHDTEDLKISEELAAMLDELPGARTYDVLIPSNALATVAKPANSRELEDGRLVDKATGETIPGVRIAPPNAPTVRTYPESDAVSAIIEQVTDRLAPIPGDDDA